jgi:PST family polysaccharide transporter/lipopolysaccharide exporter
MQVLAIWGMIRSITATTGPLFQAVGRPDYSTKIQLAKLVILAALIYPLTKRWGIVGTATAAAINAVAVDPFAEYLAARIVGCGMWDLVKLVLVPCLGSLGALSVLVVLRVWLGAFPASILTLVSQIILGMAAYAGVTAALCHTFDCGILNNLARLLRQI